MYTCSSSWEGKHNILRRISQFSLSEPRTTASSSVRQHLLRPPPSPLWAPPSILLLRWAASLSLLLLILLPIFSHKESTPLATAAYTQGM
ncbi:hypothetical protein C1H46_002265 [Malus baccata]|uniref:Uncharacterized protein n=1 Tax=Malus baccata TaxID=106549 RepID=A0A540NME3_MALBA|nr:hypothetical protein C1H46_002265 [Malus baccata]